MAFTSDPLYVLTVLCFCVVLSEWLSNNTSFRHLGSALLVIVIAAVLANFSLIPTASNATPLYEGIFHYVAPISIFYLLLGVNLRELKQAGPPMLLIFLLGAMGTILGVLTGMWIISGSTALGEHYAAIGGMFTGTYIGGGINFNAVALHYDIMKTGNLFAGAIAVDNIMTTLWMIITIALPKLLFALFPREKSIQQANTSAAAVNSSDLETETLNPLDFGIMAGLGVAALWVSEGLASISGAAGFPIPSIIIITTIALVMAQMPFFQQLKGAKVLGMFSVYLFLAVVGAYCEIFALAEIGAIGVALMIFASVLVLIHGLICFGGGMLISRDWDLIAVASQANIGGSTSALALAKSLSRNDLLLPGILVGSLGNGIGTYLGFLVAGLL